MTFNKNIFQVWFQGCNNVENATFRQNMLNWQLINKDWNYKCLSDADLRKECAAFSKECLDTYSSFDVMHLKIDFGRYVTLYNHGGIYTDVDTYVLRPLSSSSHINKIIKLCNENRHAIGVSNTKNNPYDAIFFQKISMYNNGIIIASKQNPFLKSYIQNIIQNSVKTVKYKDKFLKVQYTTGPYSLTKNIESYSQFSEENVLYVLHPSIFDTCSGNTCAITYETICLHIYEDSWLPSYMKTMNNIGNILNKYSFYIFIIIIITVLISCRKCKE
jgi:mannosyltransferase OCH1-like enzyme